MPSPAKGYRLGTAAAILTGAAVRWWWIFEKHPPRDYISSDMRSYVDAALTLFDPRHSMGAFDRFYPPGMAWTFGPLFAADPTHTLASLFLWLTSVAVIVQVGWLARRLYGDTVALVATWAAALYFPFIDYSAYYLAEIPLTCALLLGVSALLASTGIDRAELGTKGRILRGIVGGLAFGYAFALKSLAMLVFVAAFGIIAGTLLRARRPAALAGPAAAAAVLFTIVGGLSVRCTMVSEGKFCLNGNEWGQRILIGYYERTRAFEFVDEKRNFSTRFGSPTHIQRCYTEDRVIPYGPYESEPLASIAWEWIKSDPLRASFRAVENVFDLIIGGTPWPTSATAQRDLGTLFKHLFLGVVLAPMLMYLGRSQSSLLKLRMVTLRDALMLAPYAGVIVTAVLAGAEPRYRVPMDAFGLILGACGWVGRKRIQEWPQVPEPRSP